MSTAQTHSPPNEDPATDTDRPTPRIMPRRARIDAAHAASSPPEPGPSEHAAQGATNGPAALDEPPAGPISMEPSEPLLELEEPAPELLSAIAGLSHAARQEQLELQAAQLGDHLRERLREVDRREAQINARAAQVEAEMRTSRVWLHEREHEFLEREKELRRQIDDLRAATSRQVDEEAADGLCAEAARQALSQREHQLQLKENELRERRFEADRQIAALRHAQQIWDQERARQEADLARERDRLAEAYRQQTAQRDEELAALQQRLAEQLRELEAERAGLAADRKAWRDERQAQAEAIQRQKDEVQTQLDDRRQRLDARAAWIDEQKSGLEQVRGEILQWHREALESRLLAEQLWSQISGRLAPLEITHAIAQLRLKLAEHYRLEEESLAQRKQELLAIAERASGQHRELGQLRDGLKAWLGARQGEIESQAATLVQRELALDEQQEQLRRERRQMQIQRREHERQSVLQPS